MPSYSNPKLSKRRLLEPNITCIIIIILAVTHKVAIRKVPTTVTTILTNKIIVINVIITIIIVLILFNVITVITNF